MPFKTADDGHVYRNDKKPSSSHHGSVRPETGLKNGSKFSEADFGKIIYGDLYEPNYKPDHKTMEGNRKEIQLAERFLKAAEDKLEAGKKHGIDKDKKEHLERIIKTQKNRMTIARNNMMKLSQN